MDYFVELMQLSLGNRCSISGIPTKEEWLQIFETANRQSVAGIVSAGLEKLTKEQRPPKVLLLQWIGIVQAVRQRNQFMDVAVAKLCKEIKNLNARLFVFKGQTLAALYPDGGLRQSGDIDFIVHPEDKTQTMTWLESHQVENFVDDATEKHMAFQINGVDYEMHKMIAAFNIGSHRRYWEREVMPQIWATIKYINICGSSVPTLSATYNALYVFVHIFHHLISSGIGLRQFCDWLMVLKTSKEEINVELLDRHLKKLGLRKAYTGLGAILTDYLGMKEEIFPFIICEKDHKRAPSLMKNILEMGNFGHNKEYSHKEGIKRGIEHLAFISKQARLFGHYAPAEAWGRIPYMFRWWGIKIWKRLRRKKNDAPHSKELFQVL